MTVTARIAVSVDLGRIRQVIPLEGDRECQITWVDAAGRYVGGTVACSAASLNAILTARLTFSADTDYATEETTRHDHR